MSARPGVTPAGPGPVACGHCDGTGRCPLPACGCCGPLPARPGGHCTACHGTGRRPAPPRLVIVGCGAAKLSHPAPAAALYTGQHFRLAMKTALVLAGPHRMLILSARYGLVGPGEVIAPYDVTIGQPGAVGAALVAQQAAARGITAAPVLVLASRRYADVCRAVWPDVAAPLTGLGIGRQRAALAAMIRQGVASS